MGIKRVVLVEPKAPASHVYSLTRMPRLGLPILGTRLKELGYDVRLVYGMGSEIKVSDLIAADLIGISTTTSTCKEAYSIARFARNRGTPVVLGGVHVSFMPDEALDHSDFVCRGEADNTFIELLDCLSRDELPLNVPGVSFRTEEGENVHNPLPDWVDVTQSPIPDIGLFQNMRRMRTYPVAASRGCPFDCTFCSVTKMFGHKYRCRTVEQVLEELAQYKGKNVFFSDDHFSADSQRTKRLMKAMLEKRVLPKWWGAQVRTDAAKDDELLYLMKMARCGAVYVGMESVNPQTLKAYNKRQDLADIENCVRKFHEYEIFVHGMFVLGSDDDTIETIRDTVDFALQARIDTVQFAILVPFPGTPIFSQMVKENRLLTRDWSFYDGHHVVFRPKQMSPVELQTETIKAFQKFYALKNFLHNSMITGIRSAVYRGAGNYLVEKWNKEAGWYLDFLRSVSGEVPSKNGYSRVLQQTVKKLVELKISIQENAVTVELQGYLDNLALAEVTKIIGKALPSYRPKLTVNALKLRFTSEAVVKHFAQTMNSLAGRYNVEVKLPDPGGFQEVLEQYNLAVPHFEYS